MQAISRRNRRYSEQLSGRTKPSSFSEPATVTARVQTIKPSGMGRLSSRVCHNVAGLRRIFARLGLQKPAGEVEFTTTPHAIAADVELNQN
jgi:hypothetical protein